MIIILLDVLVLLFFVVVFFNTRRWGLRAPISMFTLSFLALFGLPTGTEYDPLIALMHLMFLATACYIWALVLARGPVLWKRAQRLFPRFEPRTAAAVGLVIASVSIAFLGRRAEATGSLEHAVLGMRAQAWGEVGYFQARIGGNFLKNAGGAAIALAVYFYFVDRRRRSVGLAMLIILCGGYGVFMIFGGGRSGPVTFAVLLVTAWLAFCRPRANRVYAVAVIAGFLALVFGTMAARYRLQGLTFDRFGEAFLSSSKPVAIAEMYRGVNENKAIAMVLDRFGHDLEYLHGYSLYTLVVNPIPRRFWPEKPIGYGKLLTAWFSGGSLNPSHSISTGVMGEGYANFGWLGVVLSGVMMGIYMGVLSVFLVYARGSPYLGALGVHLMGFIHPMMRGSWTVCINWWLYPVVGFIGLVWLCSLVLGVGPTGGKVKAVRAW